MRAPAFVSPDDEFYSCRFTEKKRGSSNVASNSRRGPSSRSETEFIAHSNLIFDEFKICASEDI